MRTNPKLILIATMLLGLAACKKNNLNGIHSPASVNVVNAMPTSNPLVAFFGKGPVEYYSTSVNLYYGTNLLFTPPVDSGNLTIRPITDTTFTIFQGKMDLVPGGIYSLFLAGDTTKPDTMWVKEEMPYYRDSVSGIRFVNLTQGGKAISINLVGNDPNSQMEFSSLTYRNITPFKKYPVNSPWNGVYYFYEIRDQGSGSLLGTYIWADYIFKTRTVVLAGSTDPTSNVPFTFFTVNNF